MSETAYDDYWEDDDTLEDDCDHEDYENDILSGVAYCYRCGHRWVLSNEEVEREIERIAAYQRMEDHWNKWRWWHDLKSAVRSFFARRRRAPDDDDIPF